MITQISFYSKPTESDVIGIQNRYMSDPTLSDIEYNNKMAWVWSPDSGLPLKMTKMFQIR